MALASSPGFRKFRVSEYERKAWGRGYHGLWSWLSSSYHTLLNWVITVAHQCVTIAIGTCQ